MIRLNPTLLGKVLPQSPTEIIFQYEINLDGSFDVRNTHIRDVGKADIARLPAQFFNVYYKKSNRERWNVGIHFFKPGEQIYFQTFFWLGDAPNFSNAALSGNDDFKRVSAPVLFNPDGPQSNGSISIPRYPWLNTTFLPLSLTFNLSYESANINPHPANLTPIIGTTSRVSNDTDQPVSIAKKVTYDKKQTVTYSVTDTHSVKAGVTIKWEGEVGWFVAKSKFSVQISLEYGYSHSTTSSNSTSKTYSLSDTVNVEVQPDEGLYVSVIVFEDENATADLSMNLKLKGKMNGETLSGDFLRHVVEGIDDAEVITAAEKYVIYNITGVINANIVSHSEIVVTPNEPTSNTLNSLDGVRVLKMIND